MVRKSNRYDRTEQHDKLLLQDVKMAARQASAVSRRSYSYKSAVHLYGKYNRDFFLYSANLIHQILLTDEELTTRLQAEGRAQREAIAATRQFLHLHEAAHNSTRRLCN